MAAVLLAVACKSADQERLERGVRFARTTLERAGRDPLAAASLGSIQEMGGTLRTYVLANAPETADLPGFEEQQATRPWTVVLRGTDDQTVIIEGYGADLSKPALVDTVRITPMHRP